ncbi:thioredoxin-dependent thiol peroxidase [Rheinheimera aquimaris]|uniref:thioredoxin-dependent thiol peroxidase n=1 Tax=Rheinheimera aquimaris TaxID=412437 RepID=UPI003A969513
MSYLAKGAVAPDFTLTNQDEQQITLSQLLKTNRVLIYFYPKAMTPGCTVQACGLRDTKQQLQDKGVTVVGISTDSPARLKKFAERDSLNFTLLADEDHKVADSYGVWGKKKFMGKVYDGLHLYPH